MGGCVGVEVDGLMVSQLGLDQKVQNEAQGWSHCVMFSGKTLDSPSAPPHQEVEMGLANCEGNLTKN